MVLHFYAPENVGNSPGIVFDRFAEGQWGVGKILELFSIASQKVHALLRKIEKWGSRHYSS